MFCRTAAVRTSEAQLTLGPDWTIRELRGDRASTRWGHEGRPRRSRAPLATCRGKSEEEQGATADITGPAFFLPMADVPDRVSCSSPAVIKAGGTMAAVCPAATRRVAQGRGRCRSRSARRWKSLVAYSITGRVASSRRYTWFRHTAGHWFGKRQRVVDARPRWLGRRGQAADSRRQKETDARATMRRVATQKRDAAPVLGPSRFTNGAAVLDGREGRLGARTRPCSSSANTIKAVGPEGAKVKIPEGTDRPLDRRAVADPRADRHALAHRARTDGRCPRPSASGVTRPLRDVGNDPDQLDDSEEAVRRGHGGSGRVSCALGFIEGPPTRRRRRAKIHRGRRPRRRRPRSSSMRKRGYDGIKIYNSVKPEARGRSSRARRTPRKMLVTGHIPVHMLANEAVKAGYETASSTSTCCSSTSSRTARHRHARQTTRFSLVGDPRGRARSREASRSRSSSICCASTRP